jgi:hypothetical protein
MTDDFDPDEFWGTPGNRPFRLTEKLARFCQEVVKAGVTQTEAAAAAGYSDPASGGTHASRSAKVQAAIAAFKAAESGKLGEITSEEILENLTEEARHGNGQSRINANKLLRDIQMEESSPTVSDTELLDAMIKNDADPPFLSCFALLYYDKLAVYPALKPNWQLPEDAAQKIRDCPALLKILEEHDLAKHIP